MKKTWKGMDEGGVSPIVAVILMAGITVVLAAILYPIGCIDSELDERSLTFDLQSPTSVKITFGEFNPAPSPMDIKVIITNDSNTADRVELVFRNAPDSGRVDMNATGSASATYTDLNYLGNTIDAGDYIIVDCLGAHTTYSVMIYNYPSDSLISLAGTSTFTLD